MNSITYPLLLLGLVAILPIIENIISATDYSSYLSNQDYMREFSIGSVAKRALFVILWIICLSKKNDDADRRSIILGLMFSSVSLFCTIMSFKIPGMGRMGYYFFDVNNFMIIGMLPKRFSSKKMATLGIAVVYMLLWWNMTCVPNDPAGVYPYKSNIMTMLNDGGEI